jgi:hypothetical protein
MASRKCFLFMFALQNEVWCIFDHQGWLINVTVTCEKWYKEEYVGAEKLHGGKMFDEFNGDFV